METIKLSSEELTKIQEFKKTNNDLVYQFGQIEIDMAILETQKNELKQKLNQASKDQDAFAKSLSAKYGDGTIRLETGEFIPSQK